MIIEGKHRFGIPKGGEASGVCYCEKLVSRAQASGNDASLQLSYRLFQRILCSILFTFARCKAVKFPRMKLFFISYFLELQFSR